MADASRATATRGATLVETWRRLGFEQRIAAVGAVLLVVSTFGPFSFVEAAIVLTAAGVLALLKKRADGRPFHLPFGDGTVIFVAGLWSGLLIVVRLFDRPLGQSVLALACAAILAGAGARERAKRPADDLPQARERRPARDARPAPAADPSDPLTERLGPEDAPTERSTSREGPSGLDRRV
jgi:hypothetical protein